MCVFEKKKLYIYSYILTRIMSPNSLILTNCSFYKLVKFPLDFTKLNKISGSKKEIIIETK